MVTVHIISMCRNRARKSFHWLPIQVASAFIHVCFWSWSVCFCHLMLSLSVYSSLVCRAPPWNTLITADWTLRIHTEEYRWGQRSTCPESYRLHACREKYDLIVSSPGHVCEFAGWSSLITYYVHFSFAEPLKKKSKLQFEILDAIFLQFKAAIVFPFILVWCESCSRIICVNHRVCINCCEYYII